jgi:predicted nucleotidyltransferase
MVHIPATIEQPIQLRNLDKVSPLAHDVLDFLSLLASHKHVERLIVFGSRANGDFEVYSDLDLAVDAPALPWLDWLKMKEYAVYDLNTFIAISLVHYATNPQKLKNRITNTGIIIYEQPEKS